MPFPCNRPLHSSQGFTLAELLIALAILGVIATFTIPKVLQAQQDTSYKSIAKEVAGILSEAYQIHLLKNGSQPYMQIKDLTPSINYVSRMTTGVVDSPTVSGGIDCSASTCLKLHNGAVLYLTGGDSFCDSPTTGLLFSVDPDGIGDGKYRAVFFILYRTGETRSGATMKTGTQWSGLGSPTCAFLMNTGIDPPWFNWD